MRIFMSLLISAFLIMVLLCFIDLSNNTYEQAKKAIHLQDATIVYEEYQEIYNTCFKLDEDLGNIRSVRGTDKMFQQFSKAQRIIAIKSQLNRWVEEYNAKSNMWGRNLWKSDSLPYELDVTDYPNYNK